MYLKVYSQILDYNLSPTALKVYLYLSHCSNALSTATVRIQTIMDACAIASKTTVNTALAALESCSLISRSKRYDREGNSISSKYAVTPMRGKWFILSLDNNPFRLEKSSFSVYLYLLRCKNHVNKAFPSFTAMAAALKLCKQTIITAIQNLQKLNLIKKAAMWAGKHNLYLICNNQAKEKGADLSNPHPQERKYINIYKNYTAIKGLLQSIFAFLFGLLTSLKIVPQYKYPPNYLRKERINLSTKVRELLSFIKSKIQKN